MNGATAVYWGRLDFELSFSMGTMQGSKLIYTAIFSEILVHLIWQGPTVASHNLWDLANKNFVKR